MFTSLQVRNLRSIEDSGKLSLGRVTVIVGANNSGKSTLLRAVAAVQQGLDLHESDIRVGAESAEIRLGFEYLPLRDGVSGNLVGDRFGGGESYLNIHFKNSPVTLSTGANQFEGVMIERAPNSEPDNLIHPIFSARALTSYVQQTNTNISRSIMPNDNNIVARVRRLGGAAVPQARHFRRMCKEILGVEFDVVDTEHGSSQHLGVAVGIDRYIPIEAMGAGLSSTLNLLATLSTARNKIILIEEPENDLHPAALKRLLKEMIAASMHNQFIVTTHSSVVVTRLGGLEQATVLHVTRDDETPPRASITIANTPEKRLEVLADLGYELPDLVLNEGWIIFEESSAERLIREFLAKWYAPGLLRLTFVGANGDSRVKFLMNDYREMLLFSHLSAVYRGRAWVILDAGESGAAIIRGLRETFHDWPENRFQLWEKTDFEHYYPKRFEAEVLSALGEQNKQQKRALKKDLLERVLQWIATDEELAKKEFEESASEVISKLRAIERDALSLNLIGPAVANS